MNRSSPNVLITGARGFIGRMLVQHLMREGKGVRVLTRGEPSALDGLAGQIDVWQGDLTDPATLSGIANGIHTVYHLAGEIRDRRTFDDVNHHGTEHLLSQCRLSGVRRFLYLSSVGIIGARGAAGLLDETAPAHPRNAYEISKYAGERAALLHHNANGMRVMIVRPTIVYGEDRNTQNDSFLAWVRAIKARRFVQLGQDYVSSFVYVGDVAAACLAVASDARSGEGIYIINEPIPLKTLVSELSAILVVREPGVLPRPVGILLEKVLRQTGRFASLYNRTTYSMDKLSKLGFILPFGYRESLRRTVGWYLKKGLL